MHVLQSYYMLLQFTIITKMQTWSSSFRHRLNSRHKHSNH
jgi:hypothetical protein